MATDPVPVPWEKSKLSSVTDPVEHQLLGHETEAGGHSYLAFHSTAPSSVRGTMDPGSEAA